MTREPFIAHSELTNEIYIVIGKEKYRVTEQAIKAVKAIRSLEQEPQSFQWCTDCREYDQEKHCCHRYSKVIRDAVAEMKQESILEKINKMKSEIADSLEFWDYSPNNNPLARDMLETLTNFWGDIKAESEG